MRIVIDIDENLYNYISKEDAVYFPDDGGELFEAVKNGTPLDKIRAEIEKQIERDFAFAKTETRKVPYHYGIATGLQNAIRIIDSVINAEGEG